MEAKSKISIIVPVFNVEKYISKCINSIINQSYRNLEIILINDGSVDESAKICENFAQKDKRIIVIQQTYQGVSAARNRGLDIASGEYIGFVDSDDWIEHDMFEFLHVNLINNNADIAICNYKSVDINNTLLYYEKKAKLQMNNFEALKYYLIDNQNYLWNKLYKRHLFDGIRFPINRVFEDVFVGYRLIENARSIIIMPECKYYYVSHNNSITKKAFSCSRLDLVEAYIDRYCYLIPKYPELEKICRKFIHLGLLAILFDALESNNIDLYKVDIIKTINKVKDFDINDCELSKDDKKLLVLTFKDLNNFIVAAKLIKTKGVLKPEILNEQV